MAAPENESDIGGGEREFKSTLWTTVLRARDPSSPERRRALGRLIETYWKPVYFFVRRRGHDVESAKDLTQSFFATFLEKDFLKDVSPERGKFRSFVLATLTHFLSNEYDRSRAKKRGGHFNFVAAENDLVSAEPTPEQAFFKQWAQEILTAAMERLRAESTPEDFSLLGGATPPDLSVSDRKNRLRRMRQRLRGYLRQQILPSVHGEAEADAEIRELFSASPQNP